MMSTNLAPNSTASAACYSRVHRLREDFVNPDQRRDDHPVDRRERGRRRSVERTILGDGMHCRPAASEHRCDHATA